MNDSNLGDGAVILMHDIHGPSVDAALRLICIVAGAQKATGALPVRFPQQTVRPLDSLQYCSKEPERMLRKLLTVRRLPFSGRFHTAIP